ncbi:MAG TPA: zf-HC2 domain-containing protein, partial [Thermomicrobiales bacterium]|nr:zf-HC2 domain-containing protein [Thermomicrobiales bacterium]
MNAHERAQLLLSERLDGPLSLADARELQAHLVSCQACRGFADEMERLTGGLRALPRLPASPIVSRGVLDAIDGGMSGWGWLRRGFGFAGSPTVAIASSMALVAALAGTIYLAANPDGGQPDPQATSGAVAVAPEITAPAIVAPTEEPTREPNPEPTIPPRSIVPGRTPTPSPTSTSTPLPT